MKIYGLIIGCSKSGTTSLYRYLTQHPSIAACTEKEPKFFTGENWSKGLDRYRSLWEEFGEVLMEASTLYTWVPMLPNAAERIESVEEKGNFRFIYIMRDPIARAESQIKWSASRGYVSPKDPVEDPWLMNVSRYAKQLDEYEQRFGRNRLHLITLDALKNHPEAVLRETCDFLGVSRDFEFDVRRKHNQSKEKVVPGRFWNRLRNVEWLHHAVRTVPSEYRGIIRKWVNPKAKDAEEQYCLTTEQRRRFIDALSDDLRRLEQFYEVDTSPWSLTP